MIMGSLYEPEGGPPLPFVLGSPEAVDFTDDGNRESFNEALDDLTTVDLDYSNPQYLYQEIQSALSSAGYTLPDIMPFGLDGEEIIALAKYEDDDPCYLYFAYSAIPGGHDVLAEIVTEGELDEILNDGL